MPNAYAYAYLLFFSVPFRAYHLHSLTHSTNANCCPSYTIGISNFFVGKNEKVLTLYDRVHQLTKPMIQLNCSFFFSFFCMVSHIAYDNECRSMCTIRIYSECRAILQHCEFQTQSVGFLTTKKKQYFTNDNKANGRPKNHRKYIFYEISWHLLCFLASCVCCAFSK